jgi:hypothetical protein
MMALEGTEDRQPSVLAELSWLLGASGPTLTTAYCCLGVSHLSR